MIVIGMNAANYDRCHIQIGEILPHNVMQQVIVLSLAKET